MSQATSTRFTKTWTQTLDDIEITFEKWGVKDWSVAPRKPSARYYLPASEREVTIRFMLRGDEIRLPSSAQDNHANNLRVLWYAIEAMRLNEARGLTSIMQEAYAQLPAPRKERDPWEMLGVRPDAPRDIVDAAYRAAAKRAHPDTGGSTEEMAALTAAYEAATRA